MRNLSEAIVLATQAHAGQVDKTGAAYIHHPLRVMERVRTGFIPAEVNIELAMQAAVLHDVIEDTFVTASDLSAAGFDPQVVIAVERLSKQPGENYQDFVRRALFHPIARVVKYHDIADNSDPVRLYQLDEETRNRLITKYNKAKALF